jgi:hypothetical protein
MSPELNLGYRDGDGSWVSFDSLVNVPGGENFWALGDGLISPFSSTLDLTIGGTSTASAKFAFMNVNAGNPTLRIYDSSSTDYLSLSHDGSNALITTNAGNVTIGSGAGDFTIGESGTAVDLLFAESANIEAASGKFITMTDIGNISPETTATYDLGSTTLRWDDVFAANANLSNELRLVDGGGTYYTGFKAPADLTGTSNYVYTLPADYGSNGQVLTTDSAGTLSWTTPAAGPGGSSNWQLNSAALSPNISSYDLLIGANSTASALFRVAGITPTTGNAMSLAANSLTTGIGFNLSSTSTGLTTGKLFNLNWEPSSPATASGDLFSLNIGAHGDLTGNLFRITDSGSDLFKVSTSKITSAIPHEFLAAGDVSIAYDLVFSNQTQATIDSYGPLTLRAGEVFESNNLKLQTYNSGNILLEPAYGGKVVVGTGSATLKLSVSDAQPATAAAIIENVHQGTNADGLVVKLGFTGSGNANNHFISFLNGSGVIHGKIRSAGTTVSYDANGVDMAEYFVKDGTTFVPGEVAVQGLNGATKTDLAYDNRTLGVVSTAPGFVGGEEGPNKVLVGIVGQVPVKIAANSDAIQPGDLITTATVAGKAMKATKPGQILGKALQSWNPANPTDSILVYLNVGYGDPNGYLAFDQSGNLNLPGKLTINGDLIVQGKNILADLNSLQATTNTLTTQVNGLQAAVSTINNTLASINNTINKLDQSFFTNRLGVGVAAPATDSGKLIDTASGAYLSESGVWTNVSDASKKENYTSIDKDLILDKIVNLDITQWNYITDSNNIVHIGPTAQDFHAAFGLGQDNKTISTIDPASIALVGVQALNEKLNQFVGAYSNTPVPSITPTPTIDPLIARIESLEATVATLSANTTQSPDLSIDDVLDSSESALLADTSIETLEYDILQTDLELLKQDLEIASLSASLNDQPLLITESNTQASLDTLIVTGDTILNNVGITGTITAGIIEVNGLEGTISTIIGPLQLQTNVLAGNIEAFNGAIVMSPQGNITINGTLTAEKVVAEEIETDSLTATGAVLGKLTIATNSADLASASAHVRAIHELPLPNSATDAATLIPSIGSATLPALQTLLLVENTGVTDASKVFITPIGFVDQVISVVDVLPGQGFVVGIAKATSKPITFNWWIIN